MLSHTEKSKEFFNNTDNYIRSNVIISFRKLLVKKLLGNFKDKEIIDIGCGNGELSIEYLPENSITYLDVSEKMLDVVRNKIPSDLKDKTTFINDDINSVPSVKKYDIVLCIGVAAHVYDIENLFLKLSTLIKDGGILLFQYSDYRKFITRLNRLKAKLLNSDSYNYKINQTTSMDIEMHLKNAGFHITAKEPYFPVSPFFLPFRQKNRLKLVTYSNKNRLFRLFGSEIILVLKK
jgi:cyclopropane fatty-acyl-phospholipid synthase-like methyltransferase